MIYGTWIAYDTPSATQAHFGSPVHAFPGTQTGVYIAITAFIVNLVVAIVGTVVFKALNVPDGADSTRPEDYVADIGDEDVEPELNPVEPAH